MGALGSVGAGTGVSGTGTGAFSSWATQTNALAVSPRSRAVSCFFIFVMLFVVVIERVVRGYCKLGLKVSSLMIPLISRETDFSLMSRQ